MEFLKMGGRTSDPHGRARDPSDQRDRRGDQVTERKGDWISTFTGRKFWPLDPRPDEIVIEDVAHALSLQCRYGGHCKVFYSVAEHSVYVSELVPKRLALCGLLHDATEAYLVDLPRPIKHHMSQYQEMEARLWVDLAARFGLPLVMPKEVHEVDTSLALAEGEQLLPTRPADWGQGYKRTPLPRPPVIIGWGPQFAEHMFLQRYKELTK